MKALFRFTAVAILSGLSLSSSAQTGRPTADFTQKPRVEWQFKTDHPIYSSPIVQGSSVFFGGLDSTLYALDMSTGKMKWRFRTGGEIRSSVCLGAENLYLNGGDGNIYALNMQSGKLIWTYRTRGERRYDFADYFNSTPILVDKVLYFGAGDSCLYAVNAKDGTKKWSFRTKGIIHTTPAVDNQKIFFGSFDGGVYALNLATGEPVWRFKTEGHRIFPKGEVQGSPVAFNNMIFIGARDFMVYALDQEKGFCHWNKLLVNGWGLSNNIHDSTLYIGSADEKRLICVDPANGNEKWSLVMEFLIFGGNAYTDSMLYVGTTIGKLHGISLKRGKKIWSFETESYRSNRLKYFKENDSYRDDIYSIIKSNEQFLEVECELGGIFTTPVIANNRIIVTSTNGMIYCLKE